MDPAPILLLVGGLLLALLSKPFARHVLRFNQRALRIESAEDDSRYMQVIFIIIGVAGAVLGAMGVIGVLR